MKRALLLVILVGMFTACGTHGQMRVDSPVTPYVAPDISDITGIDEDDASDSDAGSAATPAPAPAPATSTSGTAPAPKPAGK
ncbi:MAG TPA: hypothetical protein VH143_19680 [Kofleriaceae bacterium]|jgi:hypothetical protein|nr:hypothetical protein [Kofleriaceae bacterium]